MDEAKTDAGTQKDASGISAEEASEPQSAGPAFPPATLRKLAALEDATQAMDLLAEDLAPGAVITESDCTMIMAAALERGNPALAQSIFQAMTATAAGVSASSLSSFDPGLATASGALSWPAATPDTAAALVIGLCRALRTREAMAVVQSVRSRGLPSSEDVHFGYVVECPVGAEGKPLAVVQPQEGAKNVADSFTR